MKKILLVNPDYHDEIRWITDDQGPQVDEIMHDMVPLALATVAGMTPPEDYHVDIWDETIHGRIEADHAPSSDYDLVGLTSYAYNLPRCKEVSSFFRERGVPTVVGGPGASATPWSCRDHFDVLFIGEAEVTWPQFLRDWEAGEYQSEYRQIEKPDLAQSPLPRWDSLASDMRKYAMGCVQTTRGCPFDCEFCDVIYLFGRRQRHKPVETVIEEVKALERLGVRSIFFTDDEFIGDKKYTKELLRALIPVNNSFETPLTYATQLTMNLSKDEELLELVADANFNLCFIGIETPNVESLRETHKMQNIRTDLVADVHRILSYGIPIRSGIIVGFDHDGPDIFDIQYDFIQRAYLCSMSLNMLKAAIGTRLWRRLRQEGRVLDISATAGMGLARGTTNIVPTRMSRVELMRGFRDLVEKVHTWESFAERMCGWVSIVKRRPNVEQRPTTDEEMNRLTTTLRLGPDGEEAIRKIIAATKRHAPFMLRKVRELIVRHARYRATVAELLPQIDRNIELESNGQLRFERDSRPIVVSDVFKQAYGSKMFPHVAGRLGANLESLDELSSASTEVFVDFLVRWGEDFNGLEEYHFKFLDEICDRTSAKFNNVAPEAFVAKPPSMKVLEGLTRSRLGDDVLKIVEQQLYELVHH